MNEFVSIQKSLFQNESKWNQDLVQLDVKDNIHNESWKTFAIFEWITAKAKQGNIHSSMIPPIIVKINDETIINPEALIAIVLDIRDQMNIQLISKGKLDFTLFGNVITGGKPSRSSGDISYVPDSVWPSKNWGFDYLNGNGYIVPLHVINKLIELQTNCFQTGLYIGDVFLTGYLPHIMNFQLLNDMRIYDSNANPDKLQTSIKYNKYALIFSENSADFIRIWEILKDNFQIKAPEVPVRSSNPGTNRLCSFYHNIEWPGCPSGVCSPDEDFNGYTYRYVLF